MRFTLGLLTLVPLFAQTTPDAAALLAGSATELQRYHSYKFTQDMTMDMKMPGMSMPNMTYTSVTQVVNPGKMRMEMTIAGMPGTLMISDGKETWMYMSLLKQYSKMPGNATEDMRDLAGGMGMSPVPDMAKLYANAKVLRSELLEVDGQQRDCWVIESHSDKIDVPGQAGASIDDMISTTWIDKTLGIQLKMSMTGKIQTSPGSPAMATSTVTTTRSMKFNEDFPDSLFVFTPPEGAKETKELFPGMGAVAGTAPDAEPKPAPKPQPGEPEAFIPRLNTVNRVEAAYPPEARTQGLQGDVDLLVTIDSTGAVVNAEALNGREIFRPAAIDAVKQWRFRPVFRDGHPVPAYTQANVDFFLNSGKADDLNFDVAEQIKITERIQELAGRFPRSPQQALADSEDQLRGQEEEERFNALTDLPKQALDAGSLEKASSYAIELIQLADSHKQDWNYGNALYNGNTALGLVAFWQGRIAEAPSRLLDSVKPGSPAINAFQLDFTLAQELLEKDERDAVLEFLTLLKPLWKTGTDQLDTTIAAVKSGGTF